MVCEIFDIFVNLLILYNFGDFFFNNIMDYVEELYKQELSHTFHCSEILLVIQYIIYFNIQNI